MRQEKLCNVETIPYPSCRALSPIWAAVIYSDFTPALTSDSPGFYSNDRALADTFIITGAGTLLSVSFEASASSSPITAALYTNSSGAPGILLESWTLTLPAFDSHPPLTTLESVLHPPLSSGAQYWFVLAPETAPGTSFLWWNQNDQGAPGGVWALNAAHPSTFAQFFSSLPAPAIELISTPEPGSAIFPALAGLALLVLRPKRMEDL